MITGVDEEQLPRLALPRNGVQILWYIETEPRKDRSVGNLPSYRHFAHAGHERPCCIVVRKHISHQKVADDSHDQASRHLTSSWFYICLHAHFARPHFTEKWGIPEKSNNEIGNRRNEDRRNAD